MLTALGKFLRTFRIQRGELLKDMAETLCVAPAYLSSIENGKRTPSRKLIDTIIEKYKLSALDVDELNKAFYETIDEVTINTHSANLQQRDLCVSFAQKFNELSESQIDEINKILKSCPY